MKQVIGLFFGLFFFQILNLDLNASEITFPNGDRFTGEWISEDEKSILFRFKDVEYRIPKSELIKIDKEKQGQDYSIGLSSFELTDGSSIKGILLEENDNYYTIQTQLGFISIDKSKVAVANVKAEKNFPPPFRFRVTEVETFNTRLGLSYGILQGSAIESTLSQLSIYLEPAYFQYKSIGNIGFRLDGIWGGRQGDSVNIGNGFVYLTNHRTFRNNPLLDFYGLVGFGGSYVDIQRENNSFSGLNPSTFIEVGWQGYKTNDFTLKLGWSGFCSVETRNLYCFSGPVVQGVLKF